MADSIDDQIHNLPLDWWQRAAAVDVLLKWFKTYVVGLLFGGTVSGAFQYFLFTGFLLYRNNDELLWLTAGHVIDNISAALNSRDFSLSVMRWLDGYDVPGAESIPVNSSQLKMKSWLSKGLDFGVIAIPLLEKYNLLANKQVNVLEEHIWRNLKQASPEGYYVIGYPRVWNDFKETPINGNQVLRSITANMACLPLLSVCPPIDTHTDPFWDNMNAFYGKIIEFPDLPEFDIDGIIGMSGGPIFSVERTPEARIKYRLVGIQSKWKPESGIVRAEPIDEIALVLSDWP